MWVDARLFVFVDGTEGQDSNLLVVHGGPDWDHSYLVDPLDRLTDSRRLIIPDVIGCGRSSKPDDEGRYTPDSVAADFTTAIDALNLGTVDLLGFSWGGRIAQRIALAAPHSVGRLIIASSTALPVPDDAYAQRPDRAARVAAEAQVWVDSSIPDTELARRAAIAAAESAVWRPERRQDYLDRIDKVRFGVEWLRQLRAGSLAPTLPTDAVDRLADSGIPILLIHGEHDMTFPVELARGAAELLPTGQLHVVKDAAHMAHIDDPDDWITAIGRFLEAPSLSHDQRT